MRAVRIARSGGPEVLEETVVPDPVPGPGEVVVAVSACAVNHLDLWIRRGLREVALPRIPGADVVGTVRQVGAGVTGIVPGTRVLVNPGLSCGRCQACLSGKDTLCPEYGILGSKADGGYAELVKVPAANVIPVPDGIPWSDAELAAVPLVFLTAWHMLATLAQVRPGEVVLVLGAGSGVGSAAIQVARLFGARVVGTVGSEEKVRRALEWGADHVVRHDREDWAEQVRAYAGGRGVDVVVEHVGPATFADSLRCLRPGGRLVTCGATTGPEATVSLRRVFALQLSILGSYMGSKGELLELLPHVYAGRLRPVVDRVLPLSAAAEAHRLMEERAHFGKLVLTP